MDNAISILSHRAAARQLDRVSSQTENSRIEATPLRIALVGCGGIAEQFHLPILRGHEQLELTALVERDLDRCKRMSASYQVPISLEDQSQLNSDQIDAVVLATPPAHHALGAMDLMRRGFHVMVEKPMALTLEDAREMCRVAEEAGVVLSVGVYKRLLPVVQLVKSLVLSKQFGRVLSCEAHWGGMGGYASATLGSMRRETAGGGVLMDLGPHVLDVLIEWFGQQVQVAAIHGRL